MEKKQDGITSNNMKKVIKILFYLILGAFFFNSCVAKKTITEYRDKIVRDTIIKNVTRTVTEQIKDTITIEEPCDSLGNLKDFERIINNDKAKVVVTNDKGNLQVQVDIDSLVNSKVEEFKSNFKSDTIVKTKEVIRYRTPVSVIVILLISIGLNVLLLRFK